LAIHSYNRSTDIAGGLKYKVGHETLATPLLKVVCHQCART